MDQKTPVIYGVAVEVKDDLDLYRQLIFQYSVSRHVRGDTTRILQGRPISLLALYFKYGITRDTKVLAAEFLEVDLKIIAGMDHDLKNEQYLIADKMSSRIKRLNPELQELKVFADSVDNGRYHINFMYMINQAQKK